MSAIAANTKPPNGLLRKVTLKMSQKGSWDLAIPGGKKTVVMTGSRTATQEKSNC